MILYELSNPYLCDVGQINYHGIIKFYMTLPNVGCICGKWGIVCPKVNFSKLCLVSYVRMLFITKTKIDFEAKRSWHKYFYLWNQAFEERNKSCYINNHVTMTLQSRCCPFNQHTWKTASVLLKVTTMLGGLSSSKYQLD